MASSTESLNQEHGDEMARNTTLETLVSHLLASKRSLSSIDYVWRASEIVTSARRALEDSVLLGAKIGFIKGGINEQVNLLRNVQTGVKDVAREGQANFETVLKDLDDSEARLRKTLEQLRSTIVEASFRPAEEEPKSLLDFVDEQGVEGLMASLKESIDAMSDAQRELDESNQAFDNDLKAVKRGLVPEAAPYSTQDDFESPIPSLLRSLESHAREMANLLESLVRHYDLCVTAIKHTEGGGAAAEKINSDLPEGVDIGKADDYPASQPISDEEHQEMMTVLEKDASEVDEVVMEIRDRITEMESQYELILSSNNNLESVYASTTAAFRLLEKVGLSLRGYITQSRDFVVRWNEEKSKIDDHREELEGLREFYHGFLRAYDGLIVEVGRRKAVQIRMEKLVQDTVAKTRRLYEEDMAERETFRQDQGDYLPSDIWPGLLNPPLQYEVLPISTGIEDVPDLPKEMIEQAVRRLGGQL